MAGLLVVARLLLPYIVLRYVNNLLADMGSYTGHIEDVDISLIQGSYQIKELRIRKINGKLQEPFIYIPKSDLSIEWKSLLKGKLVSEIECYSPQLNFSFSTNESERQTGAEVDWTKVVKDLMPIQINRVAVTDGQVKLLKLFSKANTDLSLQKFQGEIRNIRNVDEKPGRLPSPIWATGDVPGWGGTMRFDANMYVLKQTPDFDYNLRFNDLQLTELNTLAREYAKIDFERGTISVFSEMAMNDGKLKGYLKPLTKNMQVFKLKEHDDRTIGSFFRELLAEAGSEVLENQRKDQVATKIPLQGDVSDVSVDIWTTIFGVLRNAYIEAFEKKFDNDVTFQDAVQTIKDDFKAKREARKAERREKREARKKARQEKRKD